MLRLLSIILLSCAITVIAADKPLKDTTSAKSAASAPAVKDAVSTKSPKATAPSKPSPTLVLESARSNENTYNNGEFISILRGNVVFVYDDIRIRSDEATWWRTRGEILFNKNVVVLQARTRMTCKSLHFTKNNNLLTARGNFDYFDSTDLTRLHSNQAEYFIGSRSFNMRDEPMLIRYDTAQAETLVITSTTMHYTDSLKRAMGVDKVRIRKGKLVATSDRALYFTKINQAQLRGSPNVKYSVNHLRGDSIDLNFSKERLHDASIVGQSHGIYVDTAMENIGDTAYTHIWGDSLYMAVSDSGRLEVIWAVGKAKSKSYSVKDSLLANTASGKIMMLGFGHEGTVKNLKIWGNATSKYYIDDANGKGCNNVSGDSIAVLFSSGKAQNVQLAGSTRGIYFPVP